jgi:hypothetical protein
MKNKHLLVAFSSLCALALPQAHAAVFTFAEDFSGYNQGAGVDLAGQGGWENTGGVASSNPRQFAVGPVIIGQSGGSRDKLELNFPVGFQLDSSHTITFTMIASLNTLAPAAGSNFGFGLGQDPDSHVVPNHFGYFTGMMFRTENFATLQLARKPDNSTVSLVAAEWFEIRSVWDLGAGTADLAMRNIDQGETTFTQLFFDSAQTQTTASLSDMANIAAWDTIWIRLGDGGNTRVSELSMVVVPEPSVYGLVFGGLFLGIVLWRRRLLNR